MGYVNCQTYTISSCFAVECQIDVKLTRYHGVGVVIFCFRSSATLAYRQYLRFPKGGG